MSKRKNRKKNKAKGQMANPEVKSNGGQMPHLLGNGVPPQGACYPGPNMPPVGFHMGPPGFRPPCPPMMHGVPEMMMRERQMHGPGFHPGEFEGHPHFPHSNMDGRPPGFHPAGFHGELPGSVPPQFRDGPPGFIPPEFRDRPPGFIPPEFIDRPPGFIPPEFRDRPPDFIPPEFRDRPPGFIPPQYRGGPPGFIPPEFRATSGYLDPSQGLVVGYGSIDPSHLQQVQNHNMTPGPPASTLQTSVQTTSESGTDGTNETRSKALSSITEGPVLRSVVKSVKPPAGRSVGVIAFVGPDYGLIERKDQKIYRFSFEAFYGNRKHLLPDVKVHFTAIKVLESECATDVKVAPGGTEHIEGTVYEGVVTKVMPDTYVLEPHPGRIRTILVDEPIKLPFGKMDTRATLLLFDRVKFQVLRDLLTQMKRATNITPQMPETVQLTKEVRIKGVIMSIKDETCTIMSKAHENITGSVNEHLSDSELNVMDEVEFTTETVNTVRYNKEDTVKAIRLKKLSNATVSFNSQENTKSGQIAKPKSKWKPVISAVVAEETKVDDISSDIYEGTVFKVIPKSSSKMVKEPLPGLVNFTVEGTEKRLPFGSDNVITQATMMVGDKVQFNIATNGKTKEERAVNIKIQLETFQTQSKEKRKTGVIVKLNENTGFIKAPQEPPLMFDSSEVMDTKLTLSEKVEFTLVVNAGCKRAIRVTKPKESVFTSGPKVEEKKEKKKMTVKLLTDQKEQIKNQVKDSEKKDSQTVKSETDPKQKEGKERSRSQERSRRRHSRSSSRSRESSYHRRRRSSSRDKSYKSHKRSRSRSRDRSHRYSRSHSRSRERSSRSDRKRSHSPKYRGEHRSKRRSRSPDRKTKGIDPLGSQIVEVLAKKREELLELNEVIARKKAIIAMEQTDPFIDAPEASTYDYQNQWIPDVKRVKSILKKPLESCASPQHQIRERSNSPVELAEYPKITSSSEDQWKKRSSSPENEDPELARKKRQLQELNESIARKRAIIAMEQKAKAIKREHGPSSFLSDYDEDTRDENTWNLDVKSENTWNLDVKSENTWNLDIKPKKSILKKRSEDKPQRDMTSAQQYDYGQDLFQGSKNPEEDRLAPSTPSNLPILPANTFNYFKKLIDAVSAGSRTSKSSHFNKPSDQQPLPSTSHSQSSPFSQQDYSQASTREGPSIHSSATKQKSNLSKQMERFLGALNKADSNMLSSILGEANNDSNNLENQRNLQLQAGEKETSKEELYDPFSETDDNEDSPFMGSKECKIPMLGNFKDSMDDHGQEDLLPHERAVEDGSGFSRIVGMKYGTDSKPEKQLLFGKKANRSFTDNPSLQVHVSYAEESQRYEREKESKRLRVQSSCSPVRQKSEPTSEDVDDKVDQYKKLQDLLQTIGLNLDTTEVNKLTDRTRERLYGKKANPLTTSSDTSDKKHKRSISRDDRRASEQSTDSDAGAHSSSPAKSSKREVYMSYQDSIRSHQDKATVKERDIVNLTRTIRNSPEARQVTPDSYSTTAQSSIVNEESDSYNPITASLPSLFQSAGSFYSQPATDPLSAAQYYQNNQASWGSSYALANDQKHYAPSYSSQNYYSSPGYGTYTQSVSPSPMVPPSPGYLYPPLSSFPMPGPFVPSPTSFPTPGPFVPSPTSFPTPGPFVPSPTSFPTPGPFGSSPTSFPMPGPFGPPPTSSYPSFAGFIGFPTQQTKVKSAPTNRCLKTIETQNPVKEKKATESTSPTSVQTKSETLPTDDKSEAECQPASTTEDDIRVKQKKRLEQFNQRMRLKKKLKREAQLSHGQSQQSTPGQVTQTEVKNVWICGHSLIFWAEKRATSPEVGMQLGMNPNTVRIWWKGVQGMTWQQLLPQLLQLKDNWPKPDIILIHLGGNDIGKTGVDAFVAAVKNDFVSLKSIFSQCLLVWSDILPRKFWRHSDNSLAVNDTREAINQQIHGIMEELSGSSLTHENITPALDSALYRPDGVHLSGRGIDTFNLNMQDFLEKWETKISEPESAEA
ncbi:uncharacterized protein si:dkeyp-121d4.3 isoform X2 [Trichomycterus rosablanca]|uniref:uncharacterized protein si:dkeyp-121d4.3 isoform X2 n=1 Tax=Trichomycterus rosablanca TaxID=2290929 RepID=UPI002F35D637